MPHQTTTHTLNFINAKDRETFESYTKGQVYEAYLTEREARITMNIQLNKTNRKLAEIKFLAGTR